MKSSAAQTNTSQQNAVCFSVLIRRNSPAYPMLPPDHSEPAAGGVPAYFPSFLSLERSEKKGQTPLVFERFRGSDPFFPERSYDASSRFADSSTCSGISLVWNWWS
jgi:hypothetical protein